MKEYTILFTVEAKGIHELDAAEDALRRIKLAKKGDHISADVCVGAFDFEELGLPNSDFVRVHWKNKD